MKRLLSIWLAFLLAIFMGISLVGCESEEEDERVYNYTYCDPRGVEWYNDASLPHIQKPFEEVYDGTYTIDIDKNEDVVFKLPDGEELKGRLTMALNRRRPVIDVTIAFENGRIADGSCFKNEYGRYLYLWYNYKQYVFDEEIDYTKKEFEEYRRGFTEFLIGVYETGYFPTEEEIAGNKMYRKYTNYFQVDPHCGGPFTYDKVEKATIREFQYGSEEKLVIGMGGEKIVAVISRPNVALITRSGEIKKLTNDDIRKGECLIQGDFTRQSGEEVYSIKGIFYIEETIETPDKELSYMARDIERSLYIFDPDLYEDMAVIIRSKEELEEVFSGIEVHWRESPIWERYGENFFESQSLIFFVQVELKEGLKMEIDAVGLKDNVVTVYVSKYDSDDNGRATVVLWKLLCVPKEAISGVESVKIQSLYL